MSPVTSSQKIYHITHCRNLPRIVREDGLWSDARRIQRGLECEVVGMDGIKRRRLEELEVSCHPGTMVGDYVPFYFCPRSVMLYILHMGNHPELTYNRGQRPIVHLEADLHRTVKWAEANEVRWAFSDRNAGARYTDFYNRMDDLEIIDWASVHATDFRESEVKDGKQAEFLLFDVFPWSLIERIGVIDTQRQDEVGTALSGAAHSPDVIIERSWYY